jgi:uncharacterized protein YjdB
MKYMYIFAALLFSVVLSACGGGGGGSFGLPTLESVEINAPRTDLKAGETIELSATGIQSNGGKTFVSVKWSVSDESIGTMSNNRFTANKAGQVEVIATDVFKQASGKLKLTIAPSSPTGVNVLGFQDGKTQYSTSDTRKLNAVAVHPENSKTPITTPVTWTSSNTNVATVDASGTFRALSPGSVAITAIWGGFTEIVNIEIKQADSAPILVKCNAQVPISRVIWSAKRLSDPQNGSEWIKFDTDSCIDEFVGLYVRDESKKPTTGGESNDFFTMISASKVAGKYQTSVTSKDLTASDKFLTVGTLSFGTSIFFTSLSATGTELVD